MRAHYMDGPMFHKALKEPKLPLNISFSDY